MDFLNKLWDRTLITVDNHPRMIAGGAFLFSVFVHPALTAVVLIVGIAYAYLADEAKN